MKKIFSMAAFWLLVVFASIMVYFFLIDTARSATDALSSRMDSGWSPCVDDLYTGVDSRGWQIYQGKVGRVERYDRSVSNTEVMVHFLLKTDKRSIWVELGPDWFWKHQVDSLKAGDDVIVHGYYSKWDNEEEVVAAEVERNDALIVLLQIDGTPVWCAWHYRTQKGSDKKM